MSNQVLDVGLLAQTAQAAKEVLGVDQIDAVADRGYYKVEDIEACEKAGIVPHVPRPQRGAAVREGLFRKDEFRYDATSDTYLCPAGQRLEPRYQSTAARNLKKVDDCNRRLAEPARFGRAALTTAIVASRVWKTKLCWTEWRRD